MHPSPLPQRCADDVLDILPESMDVVRAAMRAGLDDRLSVPQFRALNFIDRRPDASLGDVAGFLGVTLPTASAMVDRLVRAGHLQAATAVDDRRRSRLNISGAGKAVLEQVRKNARHALAAKLALQPADALRSIRDGLAALRRALS